MIRTPVRPPADPLWNGRHFFWPGCDCCRSELVVLCHDRGETEAGEGTLSRIDPATGAVVWTVDFGDIDATYWNAAKSCDLDDRGKIYVVTQATRLTAGLHRAEYSTSHPVGTLHKLDGDGTILASYELPTRSADNYDSGSLGDELNRGARVAVDRNDDDRIYVGADRDAGGNWLHRFDAALALQWSVGTAWTESGSDHRAAGRCPALRVSEEGKPVARNGGYQVFSGGSWSAPAGSNRVWEFDPADGSVSRFYDGSGYNSVGASIADICFDNSAIPSRPRFGSQKDGGGAANLEGFGCALTEDIEEANNPPETVDWTAILGDYEALIEALYGAGGWQDAPAYGFGVVFDGTNGFVIFATRSAPLFITDVGPDRQFNLFAADRSTGAGEWAVLTGLSLQYGMAFDSESAGSYVCGYGAGGTTIAKFSPDDGAEIWIEGIYLAPAASRGGLCVAARSVRA